ncbi:MAG TPA: bacillithiol biosynthesis cysteine-adding enzyme BshC [bacterium]|nr:bacillithiol biosynthesis cysteine-adding enzyme BshC [bacterium]HPN33898.1 bacillithiol biosynthesis cysteine-adding enzyme BshC [bacterium]
MDIPIEALPFGSRLTKDYLRFDERVAGFFNGDYRRPISYQTAAALADQTPRADRRSLLQCLHQQNESFGMAHATRRRLEQLAAPECLTVVTGQQVGLLTGPLYTIYKALTTCRLAESLAHDLQRPVVPVFYLVTEDHDFDEVRWLGWRNQKYEFEKKFYSPEIVPQRTPLSDVVLDDTIADLLQQLNDESEASPFKAQYLNLAGACYQPSVTLAAAFARFFASLLADWGVILLDAADPQLKELAQPIFQQELTELTSVSAMLQTNRELAEEGYHTQLAVHPQRPHLFILTQGRHSLEQTGARLREMHSGALFTAEELAREPARLSPKAALRPIVQDWLLPTIAYVAGPGEIAYWAQLKRVYAGFHLPMPVVVPRASMTLVEAKIRRHLEKYSVSVAEVLTQTTACRQKVEQQLLPHQLTEPLNALQQLIKQKWPELLHAVSSLDPTLVSPAQKTADQMASALQQLQAKLFRSLQQKESAAAEAWRLILASLMPANELQERQLNILPFLIKYGPSLLTTLYEQIDIQRNDHHVVNI